MDELGAAVRARRERAGLSQRELARRAGVTNGLVSQIEQNRVNPSVGTLRKILAAMGTSLGAFFAAADEATAQAFYRGGELPDLGGQGVVLRLVGARRAARAMSILHEIYAPGADTGEQLLVHDGEEGGVVVRGRIEITCEGHREVLGAGDAYYFDSRRPHRFRNAGDEPCEIVSANCPPTF